MKLRCLRFLAFVAVTALLSGCASTPMGGAEEHTTAVKVYQPADLAPSQYEIVRQIWVDSWSTAIWMPTYPSEAEGIASMQVEAGRVGADGLINFYCVDLAQSNRSSGSGAAFLCYGSAIRVRRS